LISTNGGLPGEKNKSLIFVEVFNIAANKSEVDIAAGAAAAAGFAAAVTGAVAEAGAAAGAEARATAGAAAAAVAALATGAAGIAVAAGRTAGVEAGGTTLGGRFAGFVGEDIERISSSLMIVPQDESTSVPDLPDRCYGGHSVGREELLTFADKYFWSSQNILSDKFC
jgi:hypothetical protein